MPPPQPRRVDPKIWRAFAGAAVRIPKLHSRVYYFPQGHMEHASPSSLTNSHPLFRSLPLVPCHVSSLDLLADPLSDEVFAKLILTPLVYNPNTQNDINYDRNDNDDDDEDERNGVVSFSKILTPSDANNGGGFSVPRFCADSVFPPLNLRAEPPVQLLDVADVHGVAWRFRHIYRGTPRRHLFTTGWSKFVNHKKLVAGDSVVFVRYSASTGGDGKAKVSVGIRRATRFSTTAEAVVEEEDSSQDEAFSRCATRSVSAKAVVAAAESAARGVPFEVLYYPRAGFADFVVSAEVVEKAVKFAWVGGLRVKIGMETEDSSRMTWFQGTVSSASYDNGPWRMLQVNWDEPEVLQNAKRVSPWQVELVSPTLALTVFPPTKRFRTDPGSEVLGDREGDPFSPMTEFPNSTMGHLNKKLLSYETFPAGMQGARHDLFSASTLRFSNFLNDNSYLYMGSSPFGNNTVQSVGTVSTELNIGSSQSDNLSPHSQSSVHSVGTEFTGTHNRSTRVGSGSFLLFGKIIQPVESDADCMEGDGSRGSKETEGNDNLLG